MRTIIVVLTASILFCAAPASAKEIDLILGAEGQATSWDGDGVAYSTLGASYFFERWVGVDFTTKFGVGSVDERVLQHLDLGVVFRGDFQGTRPRVRLGLAHQHEVTGDALDDEFTANFFGWGDGIRHRAGLSGAVGVAIPFAEHLRGDMSLVLEAKANRYFDNNEGPTWYWGLGIGLELSFTHKAKKRVDYAQN